MPYLNEALPLRPLHSDADGLLDEIDRFYAASDARSCVLLSAWPTPPLKVRGWELVGHPAFVVRTPSALRPPHATRADTELAVRTAITSGDLAIAERFFVEG